MATMKIKVGDTVKVIAGKDKGKEGQVLKVDHKNGRVVVKGVNMITKHNKQSAQNPNGGIVNVRRQHRRIKRYVRKGRRSYQSWLRCSRRQESPCSEESQQRRNRLISERRFKTLSRLKEQYITEIAPAMQKKFGYENVMQIPKLDKIVVNMGVGEAKENAKLLESAVADMQLITGQKPVLTKAKKSIANFKIREGMNIGCKVTLRGEKMYEFR